MASIIPFRALRPTIESASKLASRPYDVLNSKEAKEEAAANPHSFLRITKSEIDLPESIDVHSQKVYDKAKQNLDEFISSGLLFRESKPCYYIYRLVMDGRSQTGLVCASSVTDYEKGIIKKHEFTRPEKELDRINHIKTTGAQTGNVFLAYRNVSAIDSIIELWQNSNSSEYDFVADDKVRHTIWVINDDRTIESITQLFATKVPATYIADGHHRAASAAKVKKALGNKATEAANFFLTTLFPADQLQIMDYNRVVKDMNGRDNEELMSNLHDDFDVTMMGNEAYRPEKLHDFGMYYNKRWYKLTARKDSYSDDPIGVLDVTILSHSILAKILGIKDQRTDKRIDFVGGIRGLAELEKRVNSGEMAIAFSLYPVSIQQLFDIADSGEVMPPKSTWFEPKLRDGLLTHLIYE
ncbi:MAG: DUF1015 domain-containing protein [Chitinophagaceae bacterium]|nr:DUF1015 domain-containing protein [Chitinophagaceae bacterium]